MIFTSLQFFVFLAVVLVACHLAPSNRHKKLLLLVASYYFYSRWDARFVGLLFGLTASTYLIVRAMHGSRDEKARKRWLVASITVSLAVLCVFKYLAFFVASLSAIGAPLSPILIVLPVGISFIVFEAIAYAVDVYRDPSGFERDWVDVAMLMAFFPHLVAGPILRPAQFMPQLKRPIVIRWSNIWEGLQLIGWGFWKKLLVADRVAPYVDAVFSHPDRFLPGTTVFAVFAYALQIYGDFSGYTDMAIGAAHCFGIELPRNFNLPYLARNLTEFWRRWHISLSSWLRDYLYLPLGGNRRGPVRTYINLAIVMLLGGLWHGASWNFVVWGGLHGVGLGVHRMFRGTRATSAKWEPLSILVTFTFVTLAWIPFRAHGFSQAADVFETMFVRREHAFVWMSVSLLYAVPCLLVADFATQKWFGGRRLSAGNIWHTTAFWLIWLVAAWIAPPASSPFIYFQF